MLSAIYAEYHLQALYAECCYAKCHYAKCHYVKCHYDKCHYDKCHYVEYHESRGARKTSECVIINLLTIIV